MSWCGFIIRTRVNICHYGDQIQMTIDGHHVTISFTQEENPTLSALVRNTLLDAYIRKNDLSGEEQFA